MVTLRAFQIETRCSNLCLLIAHNSISTTKTRTLENKGLTGGSSNSGLPTGDPRFGCMSSSCLPFGFWRSVLDRVFLSGGGFLAMRWQVFLSKLLMQNGFRLMLPLPDDVQKLPFENQFLNGHTMDVLGVIRTRHGIPAYLRSIDRNGNAIVRGRDFSKPRSVLLSYEKRL